MLYLMELLRLFLFISNIKLIFGKARIVSDTPISTKECIFSSSYICYSGIIFLNQNLVVNAQIPRVTTVKRPRETLPSAIPLLLESFVLVKNADSWALSLMCCIISWDGSDSSLRFPWGEKGDLQSESNSHCSVTAPQPTIQLMQPDDCVKLHEGPRAVLPSSTTSRVLLSPSHVILTAAW